MPRPDLIALCIINLATVSVPAVLSVAENEGTVQVCATLSLNAEFDITVTLATSDGTGMCVQQLALPCVNNCVFCSY